MNSVTKRVVLALTAVNCLSFGFVACTAPQTEPEEPAQMHAFQGAQMRQVMLDLRALAQDRLPQELDPAAEKRKQTASVVEIAQKLAESAKAIPSVLVGGELTDDEREQFIQLAKNLEQDSLQLAEDAPSLSWSQLSERVQSLKGDCNQCHTRFRDLPNIEPDPVDRLR